MIAAEPYTATRQNGYRASWEKLLSDHEKQYQWNYRYIPNSDAC